MGNPLLNRMQGAQSQPKQKSVVEMFREFKADFTGDPQKRLDELMASGQYTQEQLDKATELANLVKGFCKK